MVQVEAVAGWGEALEALAERIGALVVRPEPRRRVRTYLEGLLGRAEKRNAWHLAEAAGEETPYGMQRLVASASWDADEVRDDLRGYVVEHLGDPDAVLVVDETGFLKKGTKSAGVSRQYSGTAGRIENCQVGVFLAYAASEGVALLDRDLYLPKAWTEDRERCRGAGIPAEVEFATKPALAKAMLERAIVFGVPHAWVSADEVYGMDRRLRRWLEEMGEPFVLAVSAQERRWVDFRAVRIDEIVRGLPESAWRRRSAGAGAKGERLYDWALIEEDRAGRAPGTHRLLVRRNVDDPLDRAYYVVFSPQGATLEELVKVAGRRWAIEIAFEAAKQQVGLDQYEVRKWAAWYRFITLALFAHAFLAVQRAKKGEPAATARAVRS